MRLAVESAATRAVRSSPRSRSTLTHPSCSREYRQQTFFGCKRVPARSRRCPPSESTRLSSRRRGSSDPTCRPTRIPRQRVRRARASDADVRQHPTDCARDAPQQRRRAHAAAHRGRSQSPLRQPCTHRRTPGQPRRALAADPPRRPVQLADVHLVRERLYRRGGKVERLRGGRLSPRPHWRRLRSQRPLCGRQETRLGSLFNSVVRLPQSPSSPFCRRSCAASS